METLANLTVGELLGGAAGIVVLVSVFVEITPIKINPISQFLGWLGKKINGQVLEKVEDLGKKLDATEKKIDENEIDRIRWEILDFANSCRNGRHHTKDEFDHIIQQNDKYHKILEEREMTNGQTELAFDYISTIYTHCMEENSFL